MDMKIPRWAYDANADQRIGADCPASTVVCMAENHLPPGVVDCLVSGATIGKMIRMERPPGKIALCWLAGARILTDSVPKAPG